MNEHQRIAITNHCRLAVEIFHPILRYMIPGISIVLSVNSGYE